jgi:hypothetical protein
VPYQLHCEVVAQAEDATLLVVAELVLLLVLVLLGTELEVEVFEEVTTDELVLVLTELLELVLEATTPLQALPVIVGTSALAPLLVPWKPNSTDWPGWMLLFQFKPVAA